MFSPFLSYIRNSNWIKYQISEPFSKTIVGQGCNMFIRCHDLPPGNCLPGSMFILSPNLPPGDCLPGLKPVRQPT